MITLEVSAEFNFEEKIMTIKRPNFKKTNNVFNGPIIKFLWLNIFKLWFNWYKSLYTKKIKINSKEWIKVLTVKYLKVIIISFAGVERKFFEKGIRRDRKPVPTYFN